MVKSLALESTHMCGSLHEYKPNLNCIRTVRMILNFQQSDMSPTGEVSDSPVHIIEVC